MPKHPISAEEARQLLDYNPETGTFTWRVGRRGTARVGSIAGRMDSGGYIQISVNGKRYQAHRLAWLVTYGVEPQEHIDHIDGNPSNNRLNNLREASYAQNCRNRRINSNSTSGYKGVSWAQSDKKWRAGIRVDNKLIYLGGFDTPEEAYAAYCKAAVQFHGEFANFG